jgi:hypothetical protein
MEREKMTGCWPIPGCRFRTNMRRTWPAASTLRSSDRRAKTTCLNRKLRHPVRGGADLGGQYDRPRQRCQNRTCSAPRRGCRGSRGSSPDGRIRTRRSPRDNPDLGDRSDGFFSCNYISTFMWMPWFLRSGSNTIPRQKLPDPLERPEGRFYHNFLHRLDAQASPAGAERTVSHCRWQSCDIEGAVPGNALAITPEERESPTPAGPRSGRSG